MLTHRGPDGGAIYRSRGISLGHRRLSIIDLSDAGRQPMSNEDGTLQITFNGEIYNFKELRSQLETKGHSFQSHTDTEVIVHGYEEWGDSVVEKFDGEFAFAIWDQHNKRLFLARDRLGIKPLYYYWDGTKFMFASEIKALLLEPSLKREVNLPAAYQYLNWRYVSGEDTLFQGIKKLLPGHTLSLKGKSLEVKQFWDVPLPTSQKDPAAVSKVKEEIQESVQQRLMADVPVGVYLSGGIDSASIVGLASQLTTEPVKTFSVGFDHSKKVDELQKAKIIAEHFHTDHHEIVVDDSIAEMLPSILWHLDMPHGDPVIIPQFKLSQLAAKSVKVVLSGEGADELFAGYVQYKTLLQAQRIKRIPRFITKSAVKSIPIPLLNTLFDYPSSLGPKGKEKVVDFIEDLGNERKAYRNLISMTTAKDKQLLFNENFRTGLQAGSDSYYQPQREPLLNRMLYYDTKTWLPNYVLFINDRMTMAHSIEGRVPFLDHGLVEYAASLHSSLKIRGRTNKWILRRAMREVLPQKITSTKKHAFFMPLDQWYKDELRSLAEQLFTPATVRQRGYFNYGYMKNIWEKYNSSKLVYGKQLFTLINFELWHRMFIDSEKIPGDNKVELKSLL